MELKKVTEVKNNNYAKKGEISKKEMKKLTPNKWIVASAMGIATLLYTSSNYKFVKVGVVIGCVEIVDSRYNTGFLAYIFEGSTYIAFVFFLIFMVFLSNYFLNKNLYEEDQRGKIIKPVKVTGAITIICIIIRLICQYYIEIS